MARRIARFAFPAVANGAQSGPTAMVTFDDFQARTMRHLRVIVPTAGLRVQLDVAGRVFVDLDTSVYTAAGPPIELDQTFAPGVSFSVNVINGSGGAVPANAGLQIAYDAAAVSPPAVPTG